MKFSLSFVIDGVLDEVLNPMDVDHVVQFSNVWVVERSKFAVGFGGVLELRLNFVTSEVLGKEN